MQLIQLKTKANETDWSMQFVDENNYDELYDSNVKVLKPDGSPLLCLMKRSLSRESVGSAWSVLKKLNMKTENRSVSSGITARKRVREDGTLSQTSTVPRNWAVKSGIVGYFERTPRMPFAHACSWNENNPDKFKKLYPMVDEVNKIFQQTVRDRWDVQKSFADQTHPDWLINGSVFTTLTINKNFRTACHKDAGDLEAGFSCLSVIKEGTYTGGHLVLPNWRIAVKLDSYDLVLFDAHEFHGNTQIVQLSKNAQRCSIVYYYREKIIGCKSAKEELEFAKNRKEGDHLFERGPDAE